MRRNLRFLTAAMAAAVLALSACGSTARRTAYEPEAFGSTTAHTRSYAAAAGETCEAARRALLSQGYMVSGANAEGVTGRKSFQPAPEVHVEVEFRVVCVSDRGRGSIAFVSALQDRYGLKKSNQSASVGVGAIGSLSLPFSSSDDAMVKVASETLTDEHFYERFFALMDRFIESGDVDASPVDGAVPEPAAADKAGRGG